MTAPVEQLSFKPTSNAAVPTYITGSVKRAFGDWAGDVLNVKNFGALGDGSTDDTAAIQACFNAAYNQPSGNGNTNQTLNLPVFFPSGHYIVNAPHTTTLTGTPVDDGTGQVKLPVTSVSGFATGQRVQVSGIVGTMGTGPTVGTAWTAANDLWFITVSGSNIILNGSVIGGVYTSGGTVKSPCLTIKNTQGAHIFGTSKASSKIDSGTGSAPVLSLNGFSYSQIDNLTINAATGGYACDYSWDNVQSAGAQEVVFQSILFIGGDYGLSIGKTGFQSSETLLLSCLCTSNAIAGIYNGNQNALGVTVIGGNYAQCGIGIWVHGGAVENIQGVQFQGSTNFDIQVDKSSPDAMVIHGCRSESTNFAFISAGPGVSISCVTQSAAAAGTFLFYSGASATDINTCMIDGCYSKNGIIDHNSNGNIYIRGGKFGNAGFLPTLGATGKICEYNMGPLLFADLPAQQPALAGLRQTITDCLVAASGNFAATVAVGGGGNVVPLWNDGTNWKIG